MQESEARGIFQQLVLAVDYCHRMGVAHQNIKLENVLLGAPKKNPIIKLTGFSFSKSVLDSTPATMCPTNPEYMGELQGLPPKFCPHKATVRYLKQHKNGHDTGRGIEPTTGSQTLDSTLQPTT